MVRAMADEKGPRKAADARAERLAKALKANLARRKAQARGRSAPPGPKTAADDAQKPQDEDV